jgi:hypothetical protein
MQETLKEKCELMDTVSTDEHKMRVKLISLVRMAKTQLKSVDVSMFLQKDVQDVSVSGNDDDTLSSLEPMALVETRSRSRRVQWKAPKKPQGLLQEDSALTAEVSADATAGGGPFDDVATMIEQLISQIKDQANADKNKDQFCQEAKAKNRKARIDTTNAIDVKMAEIHWAESAVKQLDEEISFIMVEEARLREVATAAGQELDEEEQRSAKETSERSANKEVIVKAIMVLSNLCNLPAASAAASAASFMQLRASSGEKNTQCADAVKILNEAVTLIGKIDTAFGDNLDKVKTQLQGEKDQATSAADSRGSDLLASKSARARRADEFAGAQDELSDKRDDMALVDQAQGQIETNCAPKQQTHADKMAARAEEIDSLKEAYNVLSGENVIPTPQ